MRRTYHPSLLNKLLGSWRRDLCMLGRDFYWLNYFPTLACWVCFPKGLLIAQGLTSSRLMSLVSAYSWRWPCTSDCLAFTPECWDYKHVPLSCLFCVPDWTSVSCRMLGQRSTHWAIPTAHLTALERNSPSSEILDPKIMQGHLLPGLHPPSPL